MAGNVSTIGESDGRKQAQQNKSMAHLFAFLSIFSRPALSLRIRHSSISDPNAGISSADFLGSGALRNSSAPIGWSKRNGSYNRTYVIDTNRNTVIGDGYSFPPSNLQITDYEITTIFPMNVKDANGDCGPPNWMTTINRVDGIITYLTQFCSRESLNIDHGRCRKLTGNAFWSQGDIRI